MKTVKKSLLVVITLILVLSLVACGAKTPLTVEGFTEIMEAEDFTVTDATLFAQTLVTADTVTIALNDNYEIEFYELPHVSIAKQFYDLNKTSFEKEEVTSAQTAEENKGNHDYYEMSSDTEFLLVSRIEDTVIYCYTDIAYKDEVVGIAETLGYK